MYQETVQKRDFFEDREVPRLGEGILKPAIQIIVPGITVPLSDLPFIVISVFASQVIHELGHALAAALDAIPLLSAGASLAIVLPTAHVALSTPLFSALPSLPKMRIISAGPFHNLVMWVVLLGLRKSGLGEVGRWIWWESVSEGVVVWGVDQSPPLASQLVPGLTVVTALDDVPLSSNHKAWDEYLSAPATPLWKGWCISKSEFKDADICCSSSPAQQSNSSASPLAAYCFKGHKAPPDAPPSGLQITVEAPKGNEDCVVPASQDLLRLSVKHAGAENDKILVWSGPRDEVREEVRVGAHRPRLNIFPVLQLRVWETWERLWSYLEMACPQFVLPQSLAVPYLDGMELLKSLRLWAGESKGRGTGDSDRERVV
ncbi:hypothetical protein NMY22_g5314 [Coprinellus aureogranulatus]|nr:hypothetical protein NMY22_g5314 [Coprinellus aureogranulatus]